MSSDSLRALPAPLAPGRRPWLAPALTGAATLSLWGAQLCTLLPLSMVSSGAFPQEAGWWLLGACALLPAAGALSLRRGAALGGLGLILAGSAGLSQVAQVAFGQPGGPDDAQLRLLTATSLISSAGLSLLLLRAASDWGAHWRGRSLLGASLLVAVTAVGATLREPLSEWSLEVAIPAGLSPTLPLTICAVSLAGAGWALLGAARHLRLQTPGTGAPGTGAPGTGAPETRGLSQQPETGQGPDRSRPGQPWHPGKVLAAALLGAAVSAPLWWLSAPMVIDQIGAASSRWSGYWSAVVWGVGAAGAVAIGTLASWKARPWKPAWSKQHRAEQNRAEQHRAEQHRAEQHRAGEITPASGRWPARALGLWALCALGLTISAAAHHLEAGQVSMGWAPAGQPALAIALTLGGAVTALRLSLLAAALAAVWTWSSAHPAGRAALSGLVYALGVLGLTGNLLPDFDPGTRPGLDYAWLIVATGAAVSAGICRLLIGTEGSWTTRVERRLEQWIRTPEEER